MEPQAEPFVSAAQRIMCIGVGGFLGANARYWLGIWIEERTGNAFPWPTFLINVSGSFVLGLLLPLLAERTNLYGAHVLRLLFAVGFLGAYTTFSTYEYEAISLLEGGHLTHGIVYIAGSIVAGFIAAAVGIYVGRAL